MPKKILCYWNMYSRKKLYGRYQYANRYDYAWLYWKRTVFYYQSGKTVWENNDTLFVGTTSAKRISGTQSEFWGGRWIFETQLYDMFLAELAVNNKLYMEIMIRNLWKRMDENYFYYFNKKKKTGIQELNYNGKKILEVVVWFSALDF